VAVARLLVKLGADIAATTNTVRSPLPARAAFALLSRAATHIAQRETPLQLATTEEMRDVLNGGNPGARSTSKQQAASASRGGFVR
jgi:hypothetical protein